MYKRIYAFVYAIFLFASFVFFAVSEKTESSGDINDLLMSFIVAFVIAWFVTQFLVFGYWLFGERNSLIQAFYLVSVTGTCILSILSNSNPWSEFFSIYLFGISPIVVLVETLRHEVRIKR